MTKIIINRILLMSILLFSVNVHSSDHVSFLQRSAEQGDAESQYLLGGMYRFGKKVPQDYQEAVRWTRMAAEQGYAEAQYHLGSMYESGSGIPQDYQEAVKWYRMAAEQGNSVAQSSLGTMYSRGYGVPQCDQEAAKWFQMAEDQHNQNVLEHNQKVLEWNKEAAEFGIATAQFTLGSMYYHGNGVPQDYQEAAKWWILAKAQGDSDAADHLDRLTKEITPTQLQKAQEDAQKWWNEHRSKKSIIPKY